MRVRELRLAALSELVAERMGLCIPQERWGELERAMRSVARELGFENTNLCGEKLLASSFTRAQLDLLASHLTVGETYFFRDKKSFEALAGRVLPDLITVGQANGRRLRIWSAGCATGEEPYSVAILVRQLIPDLADWRLTILATDINLRFLRRAEEAIYTSWPFRDCPAGIREQYFESDARGRLKLLPDIRKMVTFAYLNLAEGVYPSLTNNTAGMDLILCRNVLMYFTPEQAQRTVQRFRRCLVGGGWLLVSPCETSHQLFSGFATVSFPGAILYRKEAKRSGPAVTAPDASVEYLEASSWLANDSMAAPEPASLAIEEHTAPVAAADAELAAKPALLPYHEVCGLYDRGSYSEARQALQTWLEVNPTDAEAMALLARACANQGRLEEARAWCEKAINADRLRAAFHYLRAMILQEQADEDHAAEALRHALYLDPDFVLAHVALGNLRRRQGKPGESRKHFQIALGLLRSRPVEEPVPESEGMTSGRMMEIIQAAV